MKHNHLTTCEGQTESKNCAKLTNGGPHDCEASKEQETNKEDEDKKRSAAENRPSTSEAGNVNTKNNALPSSSAGSLQFYQGGKLVLKLQARKEEETYKWVKIKEWDPPQPTKRRKRYRKKLPKDRAKLKNEALSSTDSEEESKVKAKPKSFLLHRFRSSFSRHKDRLSPYKSRTNVSTSQAQPSSSLDKQCVNGTNCRVVSSHTCNISSEQSITKVYNGTKPTAHHKSNNVNCKYGSHSAAYAMCRGSSPLLSNLISTCNTTMNGMNGCYSGTVASSSKPEMSSWQMMSSSSNDVGACSSSSSSRYAQASHKLSTIATAAVIRSDLRHNYNVYAENSRLYPPVCSVPRQYLPSFSSPPMYQVPRLYPSSTDAPLDLSVKTLK